MIHRSSSRRRKRIGSMCRVPRAHSRRGPLRIRYCEGGDRRTDPRIRDLKCSTETSFFRKSMTTKKFFTTSVLQTKLASIAVLSRWQVLAAPISLWNTWPYKQTMGICRSRLRSRRSKPGTTSCPILEHAGLAPQNLVKVSQYLVRPDDIPRYGPIRSKWRGDRRPASMLAVMPGLVRPDFLIQIEAYAAAPNDANGAKRPARQNRSRSRVAT